MNLFLKNFPNLKEGKCGVACGSKIDRSDSGVVIKGYTHLYLVSKDTEPQVGLGRQVLVKPYTVFFSGSLQS